jgi:hypothetical protein
VELDAPGLRSCIRDGALIYAWPYEDRAVWRPEPAPLVQLAHRLLPRFDSTSAP